MKGISSIYRGVHWSNRARKFISKIKMGDKSIHIGLFKIELDAAIAYDIFVRCNNLDRRLNFPDPVPESDIPNTLLIRLTQEKFAVVDIEDFDRLNKYDWYAHFDGYNFYAKRNLKNGRSISMHSEITGYAMTDHRNLNGLHNYKSNLRSCTVQQNNINHKPKTFTSKYKGVYWKQQSGRWCSSIGFNNKTIHIGYFNSEEDAAHAYDAHAKELYGEFAYLNFPDTEREV